MNPMNASRKGKRTSVEMGTRQSASTGTKGLIHNTHVVNLDDISEEGQKQGRPVRSYTKTIAAAHNTLSRQESVNHEATRSMMKIFFAVILMSGLLATFGAVFYITTTDGSKVEGASWRTKADNPVAVAQATARVSLDDQFSALVDEARRRRLGEGDDGESEIHDSPQCANLKTTMRKMKRIFVESEKGESFTCKVGQTMVDCTGMASSVTCETGEKLAYAPDGERRLGTVVHPPGETQHSLMSNPEHHPHGRKLWFWNFIMTLFFGPVAEVEAEVEEEFESRPKEKINCVTSSWTNYGSCSYNYGFDGNYVDSNYNWNTCLKTRTRSITTHPEHGGSSCGSLTQTSTCSCPEAMDGRITYSEDCDDDNSVNGDGCDSSGNVEDRFSCTTDSPTSESRWTMGKSECHGTYNNGVIDFGEECDDGNNVPDDGCHNGVRDPLFLCLTPGALCTCARVRRDWRTLSVDEKDLYIDAINDLKKSGVYDKFVHIHGLTNNKEYAHGTGGFLPWHRWYLMQFEDALRAQMPRAGNDYSCLTIPYWDWGEEADLCAQKGGCRTLDEESDIVKAFGGHGSSKQSITASEQSEWNSDYSSLSGSETAGVFGSSAQDPNGADTDAYTGCLTTGPFANWVVPVMPTHPDKACLSRSRSLSSSGTEGFTSASDMIETIMTYDTYGSYSGFRARLEGLPHANPHNLLGGHIRTFVSPADPLFFSHHTYVDKLWAMWQDCHDHEDVSKSSLSVYGDDYYMHVFDKDSNNFMDEAQAKTMGLFDGVDGALPFYAVDGDAPTPPSCIVGKVSSPPTDHTCPQCVAYYDDWCTSTDLGASGSWDETCITICSNQCASYCGEGAAKNVQHGSDFFADAPTWAQNLFADSAKGAQGSSQITPRNMHDIRDGDYLGYSYEPDEFDKKIISHSLSATCNLGHFMWHLEGLSDSGRRLHFEETSSRRKLSSETDLDTLLDYIEKTINATKDDSIYLDDKSKELDAIGSVVARECALLYSKNPIEKGESEMSPNKFKNNVFWRRWGKRKDFELGALDGKCEKILGNK
ncbi:hypothetical protein TrLO_g6777 [Triparma laevis f. longispina]|uniref:Tyrosinase copper-binding domain-containing protein n=1 Tax=Triparma laevis f. longispina TaxID=1714387 RepID=A0A9W7KVT6_9STRA|nr:hypothetical protein TrLO_g6777 [Triparma laevis f. longispina]